MKTNLVITIIILFCFSMPIYGQFPIGKNINTAETELKQYLKAKGFTFLKAFPADEKILRLDYSDEFTIIFGKNSYENVYYINMSTFKTKVMEKLKTAFHFNKWIYQYEEINGENGSNEVIYHYKEWKIRYIPHRTHFQFTVTSL